MALRKNHKDASSSVIRYIPNLIKRAITKICILSNLEDSTSIFNSLYSSRISVLLNKVMNKYIHLDVQLYCYKY